MDPFFTEEPRLVAENSGDRKVSRLTVESDDRVLSDARSNSTRRDKSPELSLSASAPTPSPTSSLRDSSTSPFDLRIATLVVCTFIICGSVFALPDTLFTPLNATAQAVVSFGGPWLMALASASVLCLLIVSASPLGSRRVGKISQPHTGRASWTLLVVAAGLGSGILTWSIAEPMFHLQMNPLIDENDVGVRVAAARALAITWLHWGFHYWATVALMALIFSQLMHRTRHRHTPHLVAILTALLITGVAASIVISIRNVLPAMNTSSGTLDVLQRSIVNGELNSFIATDTIMLIVLGCVGAALLLALLPNYLGLKLAAGCSIAIMALCFCAIVIDTPLRSDFAFLIQAGNEYWRHVAPALPLGELLSDTDWASIWSGYYASWWWLLCPLPAFFIARISAGRSLRDLIFTVLGVGGAVTFAWTALVGGSVLVSELTTEQLAESVRLDIASSIPALVDATVQSEWRAPIKLTFVLLALLLLLTNLATSIWAISSHYATSTVGRKLISGAVSGLVILLCLFIAERETMARVDMILISVVPLVALAFVFAAALALMPEKPALSDRAAPSM